MPRSELSPKFAKAVLLRSEYNTKVPRGQNNEIRIFLRLIFSSCTGQIYIYVCACVCMDIRNYAKSAIATQFWKWNACFIENIGICYIKHGNKGNKETFPEVSDRQCYEEQQKWKTTVLIPIPDFCQIYILPLPQFAQLKPPMPPLISPHSTQYLSHLLISSQEPQIRLVLR